MAQVVPVGLPPLAERVTACENTLGTPNASAGLLERVKTVEQSVLGREGSGALPDRVKACEDALGLKPGFAPAGAPPAGEVMNRATSHTPRGSVTHDWVGALTYAASEAHARARGGRLLTLAEARAHMGGRPLFPGDDQWCAVAGRDWVQVGSRYHHAGKSHMQEWGVYPPWGDDANDTTYGRPTWNVYALYTTASVPALERDLSGRWFSFARADGRPNGDRYEFRREGDVYKIYRNGHHNDNEQFTFDGATGFHAHGPTFTLQANGDLHWDLEGGKWGSRKEGGGGGYEGQRPNACPVCGDPGRMSPGCPGCNHPGGGGHHHHHHHHPRAPSGYYRTEKYVGGCTIFLCLMGFGPLIFCCPCDERKVWVPT